MIYHLVNKTTEILPLANSHIAIYATSLIVFVLPVPMPRFKSINFYQNRAKFNLFLQNVFERWGLCPQAPVPSAAEALPPDPRNSLPLMRISTCAPDAQHPMRLALSDVEPPFQKLL